MKSIYLLKPGKNFTKMKGDVRKMNGQGCVNLIIGVDSGSDVNDNFVKLIDTNVSLNTRGDI